MKDIILEFIDINKDKIDNVIYNEFSLQHELGIFLRSKISPLSVQFERNVSYFKGDGNNFIKKEIDISIYQDAQNPKCFMELKYPRNGQYPEQMFSFCKDIKFLEDLKRHFPESKCYFIAIVDDEGFYSSNKKSIDGIYKYFRGSELINGEIKKPTGKLEDMFIINGTYKIEWVEVNCKMRYCVVEV